jgi:hypothetical protein
MAHQVGFGSESEANLIGFLVARQSTQKAFQYSAYESIFNYAVGELYNRDTVLAKSYMESMPEYYKRDQAELREFIIKHQNPFQPMLNSVYNFYLTSNNQPQGLESYNYVVAWLIAYAKKYGWHRL